MIPFLNPKNDLAFVVTLRVVDDTGRYINLSTGTVTAFLSTSADSEAVAADASLVADVIYTGSGGRWLVRFDASLLLPDLLNTLFANAIPYVIVEAANNVRFAIECQFADSKLVEPTE